MTLKLAISASVAALALATGGCGGEGDAGNPDSELSASEANAPLGESPPQLQAIREQASQLLDGGTEGFANRLDELEGTAVVVNAWASWCGPCRLEFPFFQSQAMDRGDEVAFLGIDSTDSEDAAKTFLGELPLPYPSYLDPDDELRREFLDNPLALPSTAFYASDGKLAYVHQGQYADEDALAADIERYAR